MTHEDPGPNQVQGERDANSVTRLLSIQSRISNVLALALMSVLGLGSLTWYYATAIQRQERTKQKAQAASASRAQGDGSLPSLGRIDPPKAAALPDPMAPPPDVPMDRQTAVARTLTEVPVEPTPPVTSNTTAPKTPAQLAVERELSGGVFSSQSLAASAIDGNAAAPPPPVPAAGSPYGPNGASAGAPLPDKRDDLAMLLRPTATTAVRAQVLPSLRLLLPKGAFIDCTLETAIDSTLPGMTTCVTATDAFGADGNVVLLERGTKLIGETRGQVQQGAARLFVLWTEARTPSGVVVPLDSPGTDELGRAGLAGEVTQHFWERFGAAMLVSVIDGAVQAAAQSSHGGSGNVIVNPSASQDVLTEILKNTINIPATVSKRNGDRIQVLVARDLDFRPVYELRSVTRR